MHRELPILVVGGDGLIGRALVTHLRGLGHAVVASSRRRGCGDIALDLGNPASWPVLPPASAALFVAAVARLGDCERGPELAGRINAAAPALLAARLAPAGTYCLLLSSDKVFDGSKPLRSRTDLPCPVTVYGRQKAAAERAVLDAGGAVLRLSKVLAPDIPLLQEWRCELMSGRPITPFHDMWLAPVTIDDVTALIGRLVADRRSGIFHCSGREDRSYVALAEGLAGALGGSSALIRPVPASSLFPAAQRVRHSSLEMMREGQLYGLANPSFSAVVDEIAAGLRIGQPIGPAIVR